MFQVFYADETEPGYNYCKNVFIFTFKTEGKKKIKKERKKNWRIICFKKKKKKKGINPIRLQIPKADYENLTCTP